tara:strand:- start:1865 stop:2437 length:573 start_codon:yes stop_codon:yes gene_type:complete
MIYIGVDPGKSGGIAFIDDENNLQCFRFNQDLDALISDIKIIRKIDKCVAKLELVHSFPNQGVRSTFSFGENYGIWQGILSALDIKYTKVTPKKWMSHYGVLPKVKKDRKNKLKEIAQKGYPDTKVTLYVADAILIAKYTKEKYEESKNTNRSSIRNKKAPISNRANNARPRNEMSKTKSSRRRKQRAKV